jgi:hypothetical protein
MATAVLRETSDAPRVRWIVCLRATRDVVDGRVVCPLNGEIAVQRCDSCRFLEDLEADWRRHPCATGDT